MTKPKGRPAGAVKGATTALRKPNSPLTSFHVIGAREFATKSRQRREKFVGKRPIPASGIPTLINFSSFSMSTPKQKSTPKNRRRRTGRHVGDLRKLQCLRVQGDHLLRVLSVGRYRPTHRGQGHEHDECTHSIRLPGHIGPPPFANDGSAARTSYYRILRTCATRVSTVEQQLADVSSPRTRRCARQTIRRSTSTDAVHAGIR